jgi:hypothetical protein
MIERASNTLKHRRRLAFALVALALVAVAVEFAIEGPPWAGGRRVLWAGSSTPGHIGAHFRYFDGNDGRPVSGNAGGNLTIHYDLEPTKGTLALHVVSPEGDSIWTRSSSEPAAGSTTIPLQETGRYQVEITGQQSRGGFDVDYRVEPPATP